MLERFRRTRTVETLSLLYDEIPEIQVSLNTFKKMSKGKTIYETNVEKAFFTNDGVVRFVKKGVKPSIIKTSNIQISPDHTAARIVVDKETLFAVALVERVNVIETEDSYVIPLGVTFIAKKV